MPSFVASCRALTLGGGAFAVCWVLLVAGCGERTRGVGDRSPDEVVAIPSVPRVVSLGNLRPSKQPSTREIELSRFLFGVEPQAPIGLVTPINIAAHGPDVLICDTALGALLEWQAADGILIERRLTPRPQKPIAVALVPDGEMLVVDGAGRAVLRYAPDATLRLLYSVEHFEFRPADVLQVGDEVWVSNPALDRLEVFDARTASHSRSIGREGDGPAEFRKPLGLARGVDGSVLVVDMFNARVQVLDERGVWLRDIGGPGDRVGAFVRPKDVAVGPDGSVFVTDAGSGRVHAFDEDGRPLPAFGIAGGAERGLALPLGVAITTEAPLHVRQLPDGFEPSYFVLVAEQVREPGVRVYAWRAKIAEPSSSTDSRAVAATGPHWSTEACNTCHTMRGTAVERIAAEGVDQLCISCHDGDTASAEAHPIGRLAHGVDLQVPADWPLVGDRIGCVTCHEIRLQCDAPVARPARNAAMLRAYEPERSTDFCANCHVPTTAWRDNPHRPASTTAPNDAQSCRYCHTAVPEVPEDGIRRFDARLHDASSDLCLTCHTPHWDYAPRGHLEQEVPERILARLGASEARTGVALPLHDGRITCYTCHNPHAADLFPSDSPLANRASVAVDAALALRANQLELCLSCHDK